MWPEFFDGLLVSLGDVARGVHTNGLQGFTQLVKGSVVKLHVGNKALGRSSDNCEHQGEAIARCAHH